MLATCALQSTFRIIVCVTDALDHQTEAPFLTGLAASAEEHLPIFALSAFDVGKIVIVRRQQRALPLKIISRTEILPI